MKILLDTHCWLWMLSEPEKLGYKSRSLIEQTQTQLFLSIASLWEMSIKVQIGKLKFRQEVKRYMMAKLKEYDVGLLPITIHHVFHTNKLKLVHKDPFDRMIIAQSLVERLPILTHDAMFGKYPCKVLWPV